MIFDRLLPAIEIALNRLLDEAAIEDLATMPAGAFNVWLRDLQWGLSLRPVSHGLQVDGLAEDELARIDSTLVTLGRVAAGADPRLLGDALRLEGDAELVERLFGILRAADVDLAAQLGSLLGPDLAVYLDRGLRGLGRFLRRGGQALLADGVEFLSEESGDLVPAAELEEWMDEVDDLAAGVDRLIARTRRLVAG